MRRLARRFSLAVLFKLVLAVAVASAFTRVFIHSPLAMAPFLVFGFFLTVLCAPSVVSKMPLRRARIGIGCFLIPIGYIVTACVYVWLVYYINQTVL